MAGLMYFGNRNRMTWVKCPDTGMGMTRAHWGSDGTYLNGGGYVRSSTAGHVVYEMGWNFLNRAQLYAITDYRDGLYGPGNIYFLDPFQMDRNVLPQNWAHPALAAEDGQPLTDQRPAVQALMTETTNYHPDPRATAVGAPWGYQLGTGETAATSLMTATSPKRTNLIRNPRSVASGTQWTQGGGTSGANYTADNITGWAQNVVPGVTTARRLTLTNAANVTSLYFRPTPTAATDGVPVTPGMWAGCKAVVQTSRSLSFRTFLQFYDAAGTFVGSSSPSLYTTAAGVAQEVSTVGVVPAGAAFMIPYIGQGSAAEGQANGDTWLCSAVIDAQASTEAGALAMLAEPYFDGDTPNTGGTTYAWTGSANASPSNAAFNDGPLLPDGSRISTYIRRTVTGLKTGGSSGPWSRSPNNAVPSVPGDKVAPTMYVRFSVPVTASVQSSIRSGSGITSSSIETVTIPANTWTRVGTAVVATTAGDNTQVWATLTPTTILPVGTTVDQTAAQVERGEPTPYFDGSLTSTAKSTYFWLGVTNNSASLRRTTTNPLRALNAPSQSATYTLTSTTQFKSIWIPVPDGYTFHVGGLYARTGTANIKVVTDSEVTTNLVPDMNPAVHVIPSTAISNTGGGVTLSLTGVGTITLVGLMAQVLPNGRMPTMNTFASGQGTSGSKFVGDPTVTGYSAVRDHLSLGITLKEVGAWDE